MYFYWGHMAGTHRITFGIAPLRERSSQQNLGQIAAEPPSFIVEIEIKSTACRNRLQTLGLPRGEIGGGRNRIAT
jgi:hypothetical protein